MVDKRSKMTVIDRAHRIGKTYEGRESGENTQSVILRFTTFRQTKRNDKNKRKFC